MTANELRQKFLDFMKSKGHIIIPSASLIPENDPSVLFTTAGMHPLVPYLMGEKYPGGNRVANVQKCVRTGDIDEVGDTYHHTFFEMLGNWSFGDYFKEDTIKWGYEFLTSKEWLGLDEKLIAISVFKGDSDAHFDGESYDFWKNLGIPEKRIVKLPKETNWWGMERGPCGPDTEIFYWTGDPQKVPEGFNNDNKAWMEIWNNVFIQYNKIHDNEYEVLKQKNVDTGMGMERIMAAINGFDDNYKTDLFWPIIEKIEEISGKKYGENEEITRSIRIIADHIKAATFIMADDKDISPSNLGQGYVVRRLIRRAIRHGKFLGIESDSWTKEIAKIVAFEYRDVYSELPRNIDKVIKKFEEEESKFKETLEKGLRELERIVNKKEETTKFATRDRADFGAKSSDFINLISGKEAFNLYQTYGFPPEMIREELANYGMGYHKEEFNNEMKKHQEKSRTASKGMFKGGLADSSEETKRLHTAAHLLLAALRKVLDNHIAQRGSNITPERIRFDFSYSEKMTKEQIKKVEDLVNEQIKNDLPVSCEEMSLKEAVEQNAVGVFKSKYGDVVKVYTIESAQEGGPPFSREICGGPHVAHTRELGHFKIVKEESSSAGVRRIKAILE